MPLGQLDQNETPEVDLGQTIKSSKARTKDALSPWIQEHLARVNQRKIATKNEKSAPFSQALGR